MRLKRHDPGIDGAQPAFEFVPAVAGFGVEMAPGKVQLQINRTVGD
jgi:hypothetical protein